MNRKQLVQTAIELLEIAINEGGRTKFKTSPLKGKTLTEIHKKRISQGMKRAKKSKAA